MVIPFGFSAGDFAAGMHLVRKVVVAFRETDGASSQYTYTLLELEGLQELLRKVQQIEPTDICPEHVNKLRFLGHQCYVPLSAFSRKLKALETDLALCPNGCASSSKPSMKNIRKVQWSLQIKKQVTELKASIAPQLAAIDILLQLITLSVSAGQTKHAN